MVLSREIKIATLFFLLLLVFTNTSWSQDHKGFHKRVIKDIEEYFGKSVIITNLDQQISEMDPLPLSQEADRVFRIRGEEGKEGFILETSAPGRYERFDYSVIYHPDLSVHNIWITTYRSSHGAGICSKNWLKQFRGYAGEKLELGKDIDAVSGGTISAGSLIRDVQRCHNLMTEVAGQISPPLTGNNLKP